MKKIIYLSLYCAIGITSFTNASELKFNRFPDYYNDIEPVQVKDVMLRYFGSNPTGVLSYGLDDITRAGGHAFPALVGAFLMTREGLKALAKSYKDNPDIKGITSYDPETGLIYRGGIKVTMSGKANSGSFANAMGDIMSYLTGAKGSDGFKDGPDFPFANRRNLLRYDENLAFNPKKGIEAIFTTMTAKYEKKDENGKWLPSSYGVCKGTWHECREITQCDKSVKVSFRFKSPDIIGKDPKAPWVDKIKNILDNTDKAITVTPIENPKAFCNQ